MLLLDFASDWLTNLIHVYWALCLALGTQIWLRNSETKKQKILEGKNAMLWLKDTLWGRYSVVTEAEWWAAAFQHDRGRDPETGFWSIHNNFSQIPPREGFLGERRGTGLHERNETVWPGEGSAKARWRGRSRDQGQGWKRRSRRTFCATLMSLHGEAFQLENDVSPRSS